jgi:hypothetical protein
MSADTVFDSSFWAPMKVFQHPRGKKKRRHAEERSLSPGGEYPSTARPGAPAPSPRSGLQSIRAGLSSVSMPPLMIACSSKRGAPTVFKCVWHVFDATLDRPGTAMQTRLRPGAQACTVSSRSGAVRVRGFVFLGVCCLFEIGAGLSSVSMAPLVIVCSCRRGAPTVFKCVWHVFDATLDRPGTAMQTRLRPGAQACTVSTNPLVGPGT